MTFKGFCGARPPTATRNPFGRRGGEERTRGGWREQGRDGGAPGLARARLDCLSASVPGSTTEESRLQLKGYLAPQRPLPGNPAAPGGMEDPCAVLARRRHQVIGGRACPSHGPGPRRAPGARAEPSGVESPVASAVAARHVRRASGRRRRLGTLRPTSPWPSTVTRKCHRCRLLWNISKAGDGWAQTLFPLFLAV